MSDQLPVPEIAPLDEYIEPWADWVVLRPIERETTSPSGIVIPAGVEYGTPIGQVIAVGGELAARTHPEQTLEVGVRVLYDECHVQTVELGTATYHLVPEWGLLGILRVKAL